jgi:tRNA G26 N,N-dimethylase Trm1
MGEHRQVIDDHAPDLLLDRSVLVSSKAFGAAVTVIDRLVASGARSIREVREFLAGGHP